MSSARVGPQVARRIVGEVCYQRSEFDRGLHQRQRFDVPEDLTDLGRTVPAHKAPVGGRSDAGDQHCGLGDGPVTIEHDACVRAPLDVRPHHGINGSVYNQAMMLRRAVSQFDGGRHIDQLRGIPGIREPRSRECDERVQPVVGRVDRRGVFEKRDPAFDFVQFGAPMTH
jgi:hypothetical protein